MPIPVVSGNFCIHISSVFFYNSKILQIIHPIEECPDTLAFATEPVLACLGNILAHQVSLNFFYF